MENQKSFFKEVVLFQGDGYTQGIGVIFWMMTILILTCLGLSIWMSISHPDKFLEVMRIWGFVN